MTQRRHLLTASLAIATVCGLAMPAAPHAAAQIPEGLDPAAVAEMIPSTISVPAGQTTSVDVGVPVNVSYAGGGWSVSASGTGVSVTAPNQPGSQVSVPVSAGGYSATITLVAEDTAYAGASGGDAGTAPGAPAQPAPAAPGAPAQPGREAAPTPPRQPAAPVDTNQAEHLYFEGEIHGNVLSVTLSLRQAAELAPLAAGNSEGLKLRYIDINGKIIEGVQRDIDMGARTMTLTYPEGETPDNPFILEVVRDHAVAEYIVTITATNARVAEPVASAEGGSNPYGEVAQGAEAAREQQSGSEWVWWVILAGVVLILILVVALIVALRKRGRGRR